MKLKKISAACAIAVASMSGPASAALVGAFDAPEISIFLTGATAPDNFLQGIATDIFDADGFHFYRDSTTLDYRAFFGTTKATTDLPVNLRGKKVRIIKRSRGGSVWGVNPTARANRIETLDIQTTTCTSFATAATGNSYNCGKKGIDPGLTDYELSTNAGIPSDFGVSDVEPALFKADYNVEFGQTQLSAAEAAGLQISPVNVLMMGIAATNAVPPDTLISRADYAGMIAGQIKLWSRVKPGLGGNDNVVVCRRVQGSGTQTSYNWFFSNFPCQGDFSGAIAPARMVADSDGYDGGHAGTAGDPMILDPTAGFTVVENPTSSNVRNCLANAQSNTDWTFTSDDGFVTTVKFSNSATPFKAIGILSLDSFASATVGTAGSHPTTGWSFRSMDGAGVFDARNTGATAQTFVNGPGTGVAPSKVNLLTGRYDFAVELTMQYRKVDVTNDHGDVVLAMTNVTNALKKEMIDEIIKRAADPTRNTGPVTAALPPTFTPTKDVSGVPTNNVALATRFGNTCSPLQKIR